MAGAEEEPLGPDARDATSPRYGASVRTTKPKEIAAVLQLDGPARHAHFVRRVADEERAWGLWQDGWALMADEQGPSIFPLWPAGEYAALCAVDQWHGYTPREITISELLEKLLPHLTERALRTGVFPIPTDKGVIQPAEALAAALRVELAQYE